MKTAISLPDELFEAADVYAQRQEISRSELYAKALSEYLKRHKFDNISEKINSALEKINNETQDKMGECGLDSLRRLPW